MAQTILHQPRVAWDLARIVATAAIADDEVYRWFNERIAHVLGMSFSRELYGTRTRLLAAAQVDAREVEVGLWRVRLEDALRYHPDLAEDLHILALHANVRLGHH